MDRELPAKMQHPADAARMEEALTQAGSTDHCLKGWADIERNVDGCCCCNCIYQRPIVGHPWNANVLTKRPMSQIIGWACASPDFYPFITFFDGSHGMCELYTRKPR